ncbi:unnamed protein product [Mesocestoides corti]|uniref:Diphthine--ammonia ligase n=1 Tax=Mesocestoides corti TaxID=53468 RepID=A0A0R3UCX5_MESCO|nr:unnamed protein product [Mesocestoides corti]
MQPLDIDQDSIEVDSYMFQSVGAEGIQYLAKAMNLPLFQSKIQRKAECCSLSYEVTTNDEVEDLFELLSVVRDKFDNIGGLVTGAILSNYQRERIENICERLSWVSLAYLWRRDQKELLLDIVGAGIAAKIVKACIAAFGLNIECDLGSWIADFVPHVFLLADDPSCGLNPCGEGGEFETFTFDCPLYVKRIVPMEQPKVLIHSSDPFSTVAYLRYKGFRLENKEVSDIRLTKEALLKIENEVLVGDKVVHRRPFISNLERLAKLSDEVASEISCDISSSKHNEFPIDDALLAAPVINSPGIRLFHGGLLLTATCVGVSYLISLLGGAGLKPDQLIHYHVTTNADLSDPNIATTISEPLKLLFDTPSVRKRRVGNAPPSQVCISSHWPVEALNLIRDVRLLPEITERELIVVGLSGIAVAGGTETTIIDVMRVRSLSHWAPAVVAPHSQAVRVGSHCIFAGQVGIMPETLQLPPISVESPVDHLPLHIDQQCWLALRHVHRVMKVRVSLSSKNPLVGFL